MANVYADTVLLAARSWIKEQNNKMFELRPVMSNIIEAFMLDREYTIPNLAAIKAATTQTTTAMYYKSKDFTIGTAKTNTPSGEKSGTGTLDLSWSTKTFVIDLPRKQYDGNEVTQAKGYAMSLYNAEKTFWSNFESVLLAYLVANLSTVNDGDGYGGTFTTNDMSIANADVDEFYNIVSPQMQLNDFPQDYLDIHDTYWLRWSRLYAAQGAGNSTNLSFQFGGFQTFASNKILPASSDLSTHYIIPKGGIALLDWNEPANREGTGNHANGYLTTYQSLFFPELTFDVFVKESWGDTSDDGGTVQDPTLTLEFALNYALAKQPFTESGLTPIFKYTVSKT